MPQERGFGFARRHGIARKAVAEIAHGELQAIRQLARGGDGLGTIGKEPGHLRRRLEIALGVGRQPPAGQAQRQVLADAGEHVGQRPLLGRGKAHAAGGHHRHPERRRQARQRVVVVLLIAPQVALQLDAHLGAAEDADQPIQQPADAEAIGAQQRLPGQRDEAGDVAVEILERQRAFAFRRAQVHRREETAEFATRPGGDEDGDGEAERLEMAARCHPRSG